MECNNQSEILDCILREYWAKYNNPKDKFSSVDLWKSCLKFDQRLLLDMEIQNMIERYNYCTKIDTPAFRGAYDDQPAYWVDFVNILSNELPKMSE